MMRGEIQRPMARHEKEAVILGSISMNFWPFFEIELPAILRN